MSKVNNRAKPKPIIIEKKRVECVFCGLSYANNAGLTKHYSICRLNPNYEGVKLKRSEPKSINNYYISESKNETTQQNIYTMQNNPNNISSGELEPYGVDPKSVSMDPQSVSMDPQGASLDPQGVSSPMDISLDQKILNTSFTSTKTTYNTRLHQTKSRLISEHLNEQLNKNKSNDSSANMYARKYPYTIKDSAYNKNSRLTSAELRVINSEKNKLLLENNSDDNNSEENNNQEKNNQEINSEEKNSPPKIKQEQNIILEQPKTKIEKTKLEKSIQQNNSAHLNIQNEQPIAVLISNTVQIPTVSAAHHISAQNTSAQHTSTQISAPINNLINSNIMTNTLNIAKKEINDAIESLNNECINNTLMTITDVISRYKILLNYYLCEGVMAPEFVINNAELFNNYSGHLYVYFSEKYGSLNNNMQKIISGAADVYKVILITEKNLSNLT